MAMSISVQLYAAAVLCLCVTNARGFMFKGWYHIAGTYNIIDEHFAPWSNWSECSQACRQVRYRECNVSLYTSHHVDYANFLDFNYLSEERRKCYFDYVIERKPCNCSHHRDVPDSPITPSADWLDTIEKKFKYVLVFDSVNYSNFSEWSECDEMLCLKYRTKYCEHAYEPSWRYRAKCPYLMIQEKAKCTPTEHCRNVWLRKKKTLAPPKSAPLPTVCGNQPNKPRLFRRVVGGNEAKPHSWPWHVGMLNQVASGFSKSYMQCGATLIHPQWALTAAHCLASLNVKGLPKNSLLSLLPPAVDGEAVSMESPLWIRVGDHDTWYKDTAEVDHLISHVIIHPRFRREADVPYYDMALLRLQDPVKTGSTVNVACVPKWNHTLFNKCFTVGWGETKVTKPGRHWKYFWSNDAVMPARNLQEVSVPIVPLQECIDDLHAHHLARTTHLCAGERGKDTCQGDSGGGLYCQRKDTFEWQVVGITSFGSGCGVHRSVYAKVDENWIASVIHS